MRLKAVYGTFKVFKSCALKHLSGLDWISHDCYTLLHLLLRVLAARLTDVLVKKNICNSFSDTVSSHTSDFTRRRGAEGQRGKSH